MNNISNKYQTIGALEVDSALYRFIADEVTPTLGINTDDFFQAFENIVKTMLDDNIKLLEKRDSLQQQLDDWHLENSGKVDPTAYKNFLKQIDYLQDEPNDFAIDVAGVDDEIKTIAGAQLVVPVTNVRFLLNALNSRWGSLYNALYTSDVIDNEGELKLTKNYNKKRGETVIAIANAFLDKVLPLNGARFQNVHSLTVVNDKLVAHLTDGSQSELVNETAFIGINESKNILLKNNNLHIEIKVKEDNGRYLINDIVLESAISTIIDFEDSVATVDNSEKIVAYRNFLGVMKRDLSLQVDKGGQTTLRTINSDKHFVTKSGESLKLPATSLVLVRNVGIHMFSDIIKYQGKSTPEGITDAMVTSLIAMHDLKLKNNSKTGSVYIVKPKLHGSDEVAFTATLFAKVEHALNLPENTLKIGVMDEEKRTSVNLKACIKAAKNRIIFINTGFLDRTGDEIHTAMCAGAMAVKHEIKDSVCIQSYEQNNVQVGLDCGFHQRAQIGKGMWAQPDAMKAMLEQKIVHPKAGASCAWVPSPTAAILHAMHYHYVDVLHTQKTLLQQNQRTNIDDLLTLPLLDRTLSNGEITKEIENNAQSILGYVVRWIDQGIGCSKVKDINNIDLMEDRATLRISSQHLGNWLYHNICTKEEVERAFKKMAHLVDEQNQSDSNYINMAPDYDGDAFNAALALVFEATKQPNGYTEYILNRYRRQFLNKQ